MTDIATHVRVAFPDGAVYIFSIDLLCVAIADIEVRDGGLSFPHADALYSHLVAEANSVRDDQDQLVEEIKSHWATLEKIAEVKTTDDSADEDYQSYFDDDDFETSFVVTPMDSSKVIEISMGTIAALRKKTFDAVWN